MQNWVKGLVGVVWVSLGYMSCCADVDEFCLFLQGMRTDLLDQGAHCKLLDLLLALGA
jgi:hypothetical protein